MKTILIFVSTLDGKVTKWGESHVSSWSSHQDQNYYKKVLNESRLIVMGSNTFNADTFTPALNPIYKSGCFFECCAKSILADTITMAVNTNLFIIHFYLFEK